MQPPQTARLAVQHAGEVGVADGVVRAGFHQNLLARDAFFQQVRRASLGFEDREAALVQRRGLVCRPGRKRNQTFASIECQGAVETQPHPLRQTAVRIQPAAGNKGCLSFHPVTAS